MSASNLENAERFAPPALFGYGFRPFFLLSALAAVAIVPIWLIVLAGAGWPSFAPPPQSWHAHEMLFGFIGAAIAGFMLTAIPNWTGATPICGWPLAGLALLWVAGRVALCPLSGVPLAWATAIDLAFYPALGASVAAPLIRAGQWRNTAFLFLLGLLWTGNLLFHLEWLGLADGASTISIRIVVNLMLLMITVIGGRIIPSFTQSALRRTDPSLTITPLPGLKRAAIASVALMLVGDMIFPETAGAGAIAGAAAMVHGWRLAHWHGMRTLGQPILWVLHLGYAWLVIGLALKSIHLLTGWEVAAAWLHALTVGCFSTMILAVATRASLGHTGRPIVAAPVTVVSYVALTVAALLRIAAPSLAGYQPMVGLAGGLWVAVFLAFLVVYAPILVRPRPDMRPG